LYNQNLIVRPITKSEEVIFKDKMQQHHYLGFLPKIGDTIWYTATLSTNQNNQYVAFLSFSACALNCKARNNWIGWDYRLHFSRLHLIANNSRFLILPDCHHKNLASQILSKCIKRITEDWINYFGYPLLLLETFVDPTYFNGTIYKASNWLMVGKTKGYSRIGKEYYSKSKGSQKLVFLYPLKRNSAKLLSHPTLSPEYQPRRERMKLRAIHQKSLYHYFKEIDDPRRAQGKKHRLATVLALSCAAILCGMRGYKDIHIWIESLGQKALKRFYCRREDGIHKIPSLNIVRNVLTKVNPEQLEQALIKWNADYGTKDESLAIDGKTMCNAIDDDEGRRAHIMSAVGHETGYCYTQKK